MCLLSPVMSGDPLNEAYIACIDEEKMRERGVRVKQRAWNSEDLNEHCFVFRRGRGLEVKFVIEILTMQELEILKPEDARMDYHLGELKRGCQVPSVLRSCWDSGGGPCSRSPHSNPTTTKTIG